MILKQWNAYKASVLERIELCCNSKIWPFEYEKFILWLSNFSDCEEEINRDELVALYLLDRLIIRTKKTALSGYSRLFSSELRRSLISQKVLNENDTIENFKSTLKRNPNSKGIQFLPIHLDNDQGDSGPTVYRHLHELIRTDIKPLTDPKVVIFIDDCLGSGTQISDFLNKTKPHDLYPNAFIYYCPLIAYSGGLEATKSAHSNINIIPAEILTDEALPFLENSYGKEVSDYLGISINDFRKHYRYMFDKYCGAEAYRKSWNSFQGIGIPVVFEWGCPNNAPGILHMEYSSVNANWKQLFPRRS